MSFRLLCTCVLIATATAMKLADYVVTEAGFGADLGADKLIDIKCRKADLKPSAVVLVATVRALKYHGGVGVKELGTENLDALKKGMVNLERHLGNIKNHYGLPCVVAINHRTEDTPAEISLLEKACAASTIRSACWLNISKKLPSRGKSLLNSMKGSY